MRLISVELEGYRRFEHKTKVILDGKLTALIGPNEAGKSAILDALERVDMSDAIPPLERTRGTNPNDSEVAVTLLWLIEPVDLAAIEVPPGSEAPRWLIVKKEFGGARRTVLEPPIRRDHRPRAKLQTALERVKDKAWIVSLDDDDERAFDRRSLDALISALAEDRQNLESSTIQTLRDLADEIDAAIEGAPAYIRGLPQRMRNLAEDEAAEHPDTVARQTLYGRTPDFVRFRPRERELRSSYDLNEFLADPQPALSNLMKLSGLDAAALREAIASEDRGLVADLRERANAELKHRIGEAWDQSTVEPTLDNDDYILRILVRTGNGGLHDIAQRSDGLRAFIALVAFTTERNSHRPPILLIDEAEIHLHYDAQADLIQMLAHQRQAPQVIYTTHSAGCLPQDLGTGVRIVVPNEQTGQSSVDNWPWQSEGGFGPLLLGMGASAMAFIPTRGAVIGEGAVEIVLLPTLIREATGQETLDYQLAPGASEASPNTAARIDYQGARVVWLVDGDEGGRDNRRRLRDTIPGERILMLGGEDSGLATEDLVRADAFLAGVNEELRRSQGDAAARLTINDVSRKGRWTAVRKWCEQQGLRIPNKGAVAHRIADLRLEGPLLAPEHVRLLTQLHREVTKLFDVT